MSHNDKNSGSSQRNRHQNVRQTSSITPKSSPADGIRRASPNELFPSLPQHRINQRIPLFLSNSAHQHRQQQQHITNSAGTTSSNSNNRLGNSGDVDSEDDMSRLLTSTTNNTPSNTSVQNSTTTNNAVRSPNSINRISLRRNVSSSSLSCTIPKKSSPSSSLFLRPNGTTTTVAGCAASTPSSSGSNEKGSTSRLVLRKKLNIFPNSPMAEQVGESINSAATPVTATQTQLPTTEDIDEDAAVPAQTIPRKVNISPTPNPGVPEPSRNIRSSSGVPQGEGEPDVQPPSLLPVSPSGPSPAGILGGSSSFPLSLGVMSFGGGSSRVPPVSTPVTTPGAYTPSPLTTGGPLSSRGSVEGITPMPRHSKLRIPLPSLNPLMLPTLTEQSVPLQQSPQQSQQRQGCQLLTDLYHMEGKVGEGTYGEVYLGRCRRTEKRVAIKRLKVLAQLEGIPVTSLREVFILKFISHGMPHDERRYFALLKDICVSPDLSDTFLVFEFVEHSLFGLMTNRFVFRDNDIAYLFRQLVIALRILHAHQVIHRDVKPNNVLINADGSLKLCDFGLAFSTTNLRERLTPSLIVLDYRPPEMLLGSRKYDAKVDVWSVGCLLAQMYLGFPPFSQRAMQHRRLGGPQQEQRSRAMTELQQLQYMASIYKVPVADTMKQETFDLCTDYTSKSSSTTTPRPGNKSSQNNSNPTQRSAVGCMIKRSAMAAVPEVYSANCLRATSALRSFIEEASLERQKRRPPPNALAVIVSCLHPEPTERPTMQELVQFDFFNVPSEVRRDLAQRLSQIQKSLHTAPAPPSGPHQHPHSGTPKQ